MTLQGDLTALLVLGEIEQSKNSLRCFKGHLFRQIWIGEFEAM